MTAPFHIEYATIVPEGRGCLREDLVKIAFAEALRDPDAGSSANVATKVADYVNAVLRTMEKPDVGAPAKEIRPTRTEDGGLLVD